MHTSRRVPFARCNVALRTAVELSFTARVHDPQMADTQWHRRTSKRFEWMAGILFVLLLTVGCSKQRDGRPVDARSAEAGAGSEEQPVLDLTEPPLGEAGELPMTSGESSEKTAELPPILIPDAVASEPSDPAGGSSSPGAAVTIRRLGETTERHGFSPERVYFATNRAPESSAEAAADPDFYFGGDRGELSYGSCEVSIPYIRPPGSLPEPSVLRLEFSQDPAKHVVLMEIELLPDADFWKVLRAKVQQSPEKQLLIFIHGYCATFRDAARRTAQMAYDLNYQGPAMFFSWPAGSDLESFGAKANYLKDLRRAEQSDEDLITVLEGVSRFSGAEKIHVVAHSMGNFVLTEALKTIDDRRDRSTEYPAMFDQVALAAPDVDAREFVERVGPRLKPFSKRFTVYASTEDKALYLSKQVNEFEPLGYLNEFSQSGARQNLFDLVDASQLTTRWFDSGHIYYGDMPEMISDVSFVFRGVLASSLQRGLAETPPIFRLMRRGP